MSGEKLVPCSCGFSAGQVGYSGGPKGHWVVRCERSRCPAMAQSNTRERVVALWNEMQTKIK